MLAAMSPTRMATWAFRTFTDSQGIGPPDGSNICVHPYVFTIRRVAYICQAIYNPRHARKEKTLSTRPGLSRIGRSHQAPPAQSHRRQGNLRLLFCGDPQSEPAKNLAPPGISPPRRHRGRAAPGKMDALSPAR